MAVQKPGCVFTYLCGGHKNNFRLQFNIIRGKICFVYANVRHPQDVTFATKNKFTLNIYNLRYLGAPKAFLVE